MASNFSIIYLRYLIRSLYINHHPFFYSVRFPITTFAVEPMTEFIVKPIALLSSHSKIQLFLFFLLTYSASSTAFSFIIYFYFKLLLLVSLILPLLFFTTNILLPAYFPAGLYRAALYTGLVTTAASYFVLFSFRYFIYKL